ncbi:MAG: hypothetical protein J6K17_04255 [Oscillospiraceae bacterium]|nr:hypothetical protein [Oscillospiraceae bacterium]
MKKISRKIAAIVMSAFVAVLNFPLNIHAQYINTQSSESNIVLPRAALPSGAYYSTVNQQSFIYIYSGTDTKCLFYIVTVDEDGNEVEISGTGYHTYRLDSSFNFIIDSWYYSDTNVTGSGTLYIDATYSGGDIILDETGERFSL